MGTDCGSRPGRVRPLATAGLGALAMYLLDGRQGCQRRAVAGARLGRLTRVLRRSGDVGLRDLGNRVGGFAARLRGALEPDEAGDRVLVARVRSRLGRLVSHPHAVGVSAAGGVVTLSGPIPADEHAQLLAGVRAVRGVRAVEDALARHESSARVPALQGGRGRPRPPGPDLLRSRWAPGTRLAAGATGAVLAAAGLRRGGLTGMLLGALGTGLVVRATGRSRPAGPAGATTASTGHDSRGLAANGAGAGRAASGPLRDGYAAGVTARQARPAPLPGEDAGTRVQHGGSRDPDRGGDQSSGMW